MYEMQFFQSYWNLGEQYDYGSINTFFPFKIWDQIWTEQKDEVQFEW